MSLLEGKTALITGAGRGIGLAVTQKFAQEGAQLVVNDLGCQVDGNGYDESVAEAATREAFEICGKAIASTHDVGTTEGAHGAVQTAVDAFGSLDILVCCAGIIRDRTLLKMDEGAWDHVVATNLKSTFLCIQAAARQMVVQGSGGRIVVMTGIPGYLGGFGQANFAAACAGIHGLMRSASIELQKHRITVNAVAPMAKTRLTETVPALEGFDNVTADHVAPVVLMLASELCAERTGYVLSVAGARVNAYRFVETPGKFKDEASGVFTAQEIQEHWQAITKI